MMRKGLLSNPRLLHKLGLFSIIRHLLPKQVHSGVYGSSLCMLRVQPLLLFSARSLLAQNSVPANLRGKVTLRTAASRFSHSTGAAACVLVSSARGGRECTSLLSQN